MLRAALSVRGRTGLKQALQVSQANLTMGGGLTFLNKKTWHPGRMQNQEEKWKREQAAEKEAKKLAEIRTQIRAGAAA